MQAATQICAKEVRLPYVSLVQTISVVAVILI